MSKERELLKEVLCVIGVPTAEAQERTNILILINNIQKLLAQPEQEQEPVAWTWEEREYKGYTGQYRTYGISSEKPTLSGTIENIRPLYPAQSVE